MEKGSNYDAKDKSRGSQTSAHGANGSANYWHGQLAAGRAAKLAAEVAAKLAEQRL